MRATNLSFRSPKEKTAEFLLPEVTATGTRLDFSPTFNKPNFAQGKRFTDYTLNSRKTEGIGPGSYNITQFPPIVRAAHNRSKTLDSPAVVPFRFYDLSVFLNTYQKSVFTSAEKN